MRSTLKMIAVLAFLVAAPLLISTLSASAQSLKSGQTALDCSIASKPAEFAICNDEDLITMHEKLTILYSQKASKLSTKPQIQLITNQQFAWVKTRNDCDQNSMCLKFRYRERIRELSSVQLSSLGS